MRPDDLPSISALAADKPHGTRLRYMAGCRCMLCRAANSRYETERAAARKAGDWNGLVAAKKARKHIQWLGVRGLGRRSIADSADVGRTVIQEIRSGKKTQIRARTERRILAVNADAVSGGCLVDGTKAWRQIKWLIEEGFTKTEIARRLGSRAKTPALQINPDEIRARSAMKIDRIYSLAMR